jgi:hypothetical protein
MQAQIGLYKVDIETFSLVLPPGEFESPFPP